MIAICARSERDLSASNCVPHQVLKATLEREGHQREIASSEHAAEMSKRKAETESLEERIAAERGRAGQTVDASKAQLAAAEKELADFEAEASRAKKLMVEQVGDALDMVMDHKEFVERQLAMLREHIDECDQALRPFLVNDAIDLA